MALSVVNNGASLNAQANLSKTNSALSKSLERLSTGLKINRGADGPAGLVISEQQRAQIAGLQTAIANTNKAVSLVQTGEGALNEISSLLTKIRSLALDSANAGVNDATALAANQAEIANALGTITQIATTTQFGSKKLLDGSASLGASTAVANIGVAVDPTAVAGDYNINITQSARRANVVGSANFTAFTNGTLNGVVAAADVTAVTGGFTVDARDNVGAASAAGDDLQVTGNYTGVTNRTYTVEVLSGGDIGTNVVNLKVTDTSTNTFKNISIPTTYTSGDLITDPVLQGLQLKFTTGDTYTANDVYTFEAQGTGKLTLNGTDIALNGNNAGSLTDAIATINSYTGTTGVRASVDPTNSARIAFSSATYGTGGDFTIRTDTFTETKLGLNSAGNFDTTTVSTTGAAANGVTGGREATGTISNDGGITTSTLQIDGNVASGFGLAITLKDDPASTTFTSAAPTTGTITVADNGLVFQIGANAGQTSNLRFSDVRATALAQNLVGNQFSSLAAVDVTTASGAQDTLKAVDQAIADISALRGKLGAFQTNTLESNANNLQSTLENTTAAESVVRDTDFAEEIATFTRLQTQLQAGATVLGNANQTTQLVAQLLRG
ncbi:B-type flagellin [Gemmata obscuriglobus]|uniref:Flagellin n=1 Tax=Gemmata obscuriglobus TaxID=114 RepID=A0A2Z3H2L3_9BACT|nr:flagellin [Gemmata obscuriglobus]AWM37365.1 hypothetical protein C1280_10330 [Gemmata obscuriglobus]QEG29875.1 B-type flagellin [Gemmata obscuriglobus]VTS09193.1 flagellin : Flagellin-like OS=Desulfuromonas acetoxidans DSM 684 GN=Dace_2541 PE=4 SV=1: Flagellin_N: Flagellin_C [Gemmata obscuriglobus UQM 2246]